MSPGLWRATIWSASTQTCVLPVRAEIVAPVLVLAVAFSAVAKSLKFEDES